ncbi:MarR family transcriptional regulator [Maricaulis sp.]|uniref:MarR family winged helix-turn-helix transcriptional regulator n=1 Tax=unclassified Maricaulis TaxID=2632371 RepID=UPI001B0158B8|nr:MarR family transcriptional regulator [Maricaulis sp.]MBO6796772.1 MarR family transcriptional regulator [Maricaulis sp.]
MTQSNPALRLSEYLPYRLAITSNRVSRMVARAYRARFGLSIWEWRTLAILGEGRSITAQDLADMAAMDKVAVSRAVKNLVDRGLVERVAHEGDGRSRLLHLTAAGKDVYQDVVPMAREAEGRLLERLSAVEREQLARLLEKVRASAQELLDQSDG